MDYEAKYRKYFLKYQQLLKQKGAAAAQPSFAHEEVMNDIEVTEDPELTPIEPKAPVTPQVMQGYLNSPLNKNVAYVADNADVNVSQSIAYKQMRGISQQAIQDDNVHPYTRPLGMTQRRNN